MTRSLPASAIREFEDALGPKGMSMQNDVLARHNSEARGKFSGNAEIILFPANTDEVVSAVQIAARHGIAIVPQGGNTGRCGGAVANAAEIIVNLARMNRIIDIDDRDFTITVEAGAILASIQNAAASRDLLFPLSLGSEGSCQIGGNLATNAGGLNVIRYGNARDLVLGIEAVLPDGTVWNGLSKLRKDNTGYALRDLFVGAEGTLGIITRATLKLFPQPRHRATAWLSLPDPDAALSLLALARRQTGDGIAAFELVCGLAHDMAVAHLPQCSAPLAEKSDWYVLIEITSARINDDLDSLLEGFLEQAIAQGFVHDGVIARSVAQRDNLWAIREGIPDAQGFEGASIKHDVSVPVSKIPELIARGISAAGDFIPGIRPCPFGHMGDGNIHFNFTQPRDMDRSEFLGCWETLNRLIHDIVHDLGGSISAEHGIGRLKIAELERYAGPAKLSLLRAIKQAIDPNGRMNPGKIVR